MGPSAPPQDSHSSDSEPTLELLNKEAIRENNLSMSDLLGVSRASRKASAGSEMDSYTNKITLSHIEVVVLILTCRVRLCVRESLPRRALLF